MASVRRPRGGAGLVPSKSATAHVIFARRKQTQRERVTVFNLQGSAACDRSLDVRRLDNVQT